MATDERKLIDRYIDLAIAYGNTMDSTDYKKTNLYYDQLQKVFRDLVRLGCDDKLFDLRDHVNVWVKLWAATHTLELDEKESVKVLNKIGQTGGMTAYVAKNTIQEWDLKNLKFR